MDAKGDCHLLFVPVRESALGTLALRTGRLPSGPRVGLAFTSEITLLSVLGVGQPWIRLDEDAMRAMLTPLGIAQIRVDASPPAPVPVPAAAPPRPAIPKLRRAPYRCASLPWSRAVPCAARNPAPGPQPLVARG
jgi:hypothetical protein